MSTLLLGLAFLWVLLGMAVVGYGLGRHHGLEEAREERLPVTDGGTEKIGTNEMLFPECETCGRSEGIHKAVVGPANRDGMHDVATLVLSCGHKQTGEDMRLSEGVVSLVQMTNPDYIEVES